jgi:hypothetical protein
MVTSVATLAGPRHPGPGRPRGAPARRRGPIPSEPYAVRVDSAVVEADIKYPTEAGLAGTLSGRWPVRVAGWRSESVRLCARRASPPPTSSSSKTTSSATQLDAPCLYISPPQHYAPVRGRWFGCC